LEFGDGLDIYDYGFRIYNPSIAKFLSVDPLTKDFPWYTPYQFAGNKPIYDSDLDGLEENPEIIQPDYDTPKLDALKVDELQFNCSWGSGRFFEF